MSKHPKWSSEHTVRSGLSPTEQRNPRSMNLHSLSTMKAIDLMLAEEATVARQLQSIKPQLKKLLAAVVGAFRCGGRLFYVGAGTSGRIAALDASECPPTFGTPPNMVQALVAGGKQALHKSVEGAEDDEQAGKRAVKAHRISKRDLVMGIAASGYTPFVWSALTEAKRHGARTALLCFNPYLKLQASRRPDIFIALNLGPEVLTGSTRLKAGTATKIILNLLTTLSMVRLGKVVSNLMVDLKPTNAKLRARAVRIVSELTGKTESESRAALEANRWIIKRALTSLRRARASRPHLRSQARRLRS